MHDIFRYHGYRFLKLPPLYGNIKFFFPTTVNILYIMSIITWAECNFIDIVEFTPQLSPPMSLISAKMRPGFLNLLNLLIFRRVVGSVK